MKPSYYIICIAATAVALSLQSCATAPKHDGAFVGSNDASAVAMCKIKATRKGGVIRLELPPFEAKLKDVKAAVEQILCAYVEDTMDLKEGCSTEFQIDLNEIFRAINESAQSKK